MATPQFTRLPARPRTKSSARTKFTHTVVRSFNLETCIELNLNDDLLRLDGFSSYSIAEYLEDRAGDGVLLISKKRSVYSFSDGAVEILSQRKEAVKMAALDDETRTLLLNWGGL